MSSKRINENTRREIVERYKLGQSFYRISKDLKVTPATVKKWVSKSNLTLRNKKYDSSNSRDKKYSSSKIIELYVKEGKDLKEISNELSIHEDTVKKVLKNNDLELRTSKFSKKGEPSKEEKKEIIFLYSKKQRGAKYIGGLFNRSDNSISYWLEKWGVPKLTKSEICKELRQIYGAVHGFSGKTHSLSSKQKISKASRESWGSPERTPVIGKSRTFKTKIGNVLGSYEVAYLQDKINKNLPLPLPNKKKIKTPVGWYTPDFEYENTFIEIKSEFTLVRSKEEIGKDGGNQWDKIQWVNKNVKPVEVVVLEKKEAFDLFVQAINSSFVLTNVEIKNGQYTIIN